MANVTQFNRTNAGQAIYNSILFRNEYGQLQALRKENKE